MAEVVARHSSGFRVRKKTGQKQSKTFFKLAAMLANPDCDADLETALDQKAVASEFDVSPFLDLSFQEKSPIFRAEFKPFKSLAPTAEQIDAALLNLHDIFCDQSFALSPTYGKEKLCALLFEDIRYDVFRFGQFFANGDLKALLSGTASLAFDQIKQRLHLSEQGPDILQFHESLQSLCLGDSKKPFIMKLASGRKGKHYLIEEARVFSAHRLQKKSLQKIHDLAPNIHYYHAVLRASGRDKLIHLLYWLGEDELKAPKGGGFINYDELENIHVVDSCLWQPYFQLKDILLNGAQQANVSAQEANTMVKVIELYFDSIG